MLTPQFRMCILNYNTSTARHATTTFLHLSSVFLKVTGLESIFNPLLEEVSLPFMDIQVWTKLQHDNKAATSAAHSLWSFKLLLRVTSHLVAFTQVAGEWLMKGICSQLTGSPPQLVPVHVHQWKATFFPLSGAWLWRTAKKRGGKNEGQ